jgi:ABC-type multidrug transport system fused ATPase/permease subunit
MENIKKIFFILNRKEKLQLIFISGFSFFTIFLEMVSIALIIPVFDIIFFDNSDKYNFLNDFLLGFISFESDNFKILILITLLFAFLLKNTILILFHYFSTKFFFSINLRISNDLFNIYLNNDYNFFLSLKSDHLLRKVYNDADGIRSFLQSMQIMMTELIFIISLSFFLLIFDFKIFIFCAVIFLTVLFIYYLIFKKRIIAWGNVYQNSIGDLQNTVIEGMKGIKDIIIYNLENRFSSQFWNLSNSSIMNRFKLDFATTFPRFFMELVAVFSLVIPIIFLVYSGDDVQKLIPTFALFSVSIFKSIPSINRLLGNYNGIKFYRASIETYYHEFSLERKKLRIQDDQTSPDIFKSLEFKNVEYSYLKFGNQILRNINFAIKKGQSIAIKGANGSGKSTLLNIIAGLVAPTAGEILIDDKSIICNKAWSKKISYIQQNIFLLNNTIKENIVSRSTDEEKIDYSRLSYVVEILDLEKIFINIPNFLDAVVGNDGAKLSGGQKQIVSIARALYKNNDIMIFDEANSALDNNFNYRLKQLLLNLKSQKIIIFVTHEDSFFEECFDSIYRLHEGEIKIEK